MALGYEQHIIVSADYWGIRREFTEFWMYICWVWDWDKALFLLQMFPCLSIACDYDIILLGYILMFEDIHVNL